MAQGRMLPRNFDHVPLADLPLVERLRRKVWGESGFSHGSLRHGWVYFVLDPDRNAVKIGYGAVVENRVAVHRSVFGQQLVLLGSFRGTMRDENLLHHHFDVHRVRPRVEWFRYDPDVAREITELLAERRESGYGPR